ncbi:MAG: ABC transporter permease [Gemmatimonadota bacterium]|nr:ABC transporter permease [Gemmatimonadota bacterium]
MRRSLIYFWRINLAVALGVAVATAVLTGALIVGDSVRGSLRDLSLSRLGKIDHALVSERFFRETLERDLERELDAQGVVSAISLSGTAVHAGSNTRASRVQIQGIDNRFANLFDQILPELTIGGIFPSVVVNESLQKELNAQIGDAILLSFEQSDDIHRESLFGRADDAVQTIRLTLAGVLPDRGMGRFGLFARQNVPLNAYLSLPVLQKALGQRGRVNTLLVSGDPDTGVQEALSRVATPDDLGIVIRPEADYFAIESTQFILKSHIAETIQKVSTELNAPHMSILTYLANITQVGERELPYSTISALDVGNLGTFQVIDGSLQLGEDGILLNTWAAGDLNARVGDEVKVAYYEVAPGEKLLTRWATFQLKGIVAMAGLGADEKLSPDYPGLGDANNMADWEAPFPIDLSRVRPKDEDYWDTYRDAPKAFVSAATGQRLWQSRFGVLTAVRIGAIAGEDIATTAKRFEDRLLKNIAPESAGLTFQPVKQQGLTASAGATDFSGLFIAFSQFLIISAALLVGLLFRLSVEQRGREVGMRMVSGYTGKKIRRLFSREGLVLAGVGGITGLIGGVFYAYLIMVGLRTYWVGAVGTSDLSLHIHTSSLLLGYAISLIVILLAIWLTLRRLGNISVRALLSGITEVVRTRPRTKWYALGSLVLAALSLGGAATVDPSTGTGLFFVSGALWMVSGLCFLSLWFRRGHRSVREGIIGMGVQNSKRQPARSLLCASLIGCACFVIVAVGANRRTDLTQNIAQDKASGTGGFALIAEVDVPIYRDFNSKDGQFELGFSQADAELLNQARFIPMRVLPGEDASCLNLYKPESPRVLGVPEALRQRGGFTFQQTSVEVENPWALLSEDLGAGVIPAIGDYNSAMWILHKQLGDDIEVQNEIGETVRLRLVGLLKTSIFQSELLISEDNFLRHFPDQSGYGAFLVETQQPIQLTALLESRLKDIGLDAVSTAQKLAHFQEVENTYLSTFQTLGGLGLLLGTLGLSIVLLRNVIERRGELAVLRAFGFRRAVLSRMLLAENGFLMLVGLAIGSVSALIAVAPHVMSYGALIPWGSLALTLVIIYGAGLIASAIAVFYALRAPLLPALKQEM